MISIILSELAPTVKMMGLLLSRWHAKIYIRSQLHICFADWPIRCNPPSRNSRLVSPFDNGRQGPLSIQNPGEDLPGEPTNIIGLVGTFSFDCKFASSLQEVLLDLDAHRCKAAQLHVSVGG